MLSLLNVFKASFSAQNRAVGASVIWGRREEWRGSGYSSSFKHVLLFLSLFSFLFKHLFLFNIVVFGCSSVSWESCSPSALCLVQVAGMVIISYLVVFGVSWVVFGWGTTCLTLLVSSDLVRCFFGVFRRVKDRHHLLHHSPLLKKLCLR